MSIIHFLYALAATVAIYACLPQLRKLTQTKQSDEFSLSTWVIWLVTQGVAVLYAITISDPLYATVSVVWLGFYALMVTLIVKYRKEAKLAVVQEVTQKP
jgi:uncharacterized protein with PQ loop repeat